MAQILIRDLKDSVVRRLKERARRRGRSLQSELKHLLEAEARSTSLDDALDRAREIRMAQGRAFDDSAKEIREDRAR